MKCPTDEETLVLAERQGIEIDYCPRCRGVWLDRGELDKLIERAEGERYEAAPLRRDRDDLGGLSRRDRDWDEDDDDRHRMYGPRRKRKGFLSEMFEFGGDD
ncbi:MAG: zf-TFIIB domain-containing protein [Actinobacteria bacterium]|nr:zf-TFIIB domain-containing protein [Actinomycetota bacterium]